MVKYTFFIKIKFKENLNVSLGKDFSIIHSYTLFFTVCSIRDQRPCILHAVYSST